MSKKTKKKNLQQRKKHFPWVQAIVVVVLILGTVLTLANRNNTPVTGGTPAITVDQERHPVAAPAKEGASRHQEHVRAAPGDDAGLDAKAVAEFAAGASHEINNPLAVIAGNVQLLKNLDPDIMARLGLHS